MMPTWYNARQWGHGLVYKSRRDLIDDIRAGRPATSKLSDPASDGAGSSAKRLRTYRPRWYCDHLFAKK